MSLSFVTMLLGELDWMVRQSVELENALLSVERLLAYSELQPIEDIEISGLVSTLGQTPTRPSLADSAVASLPGIRVISTLPQLSPSWPTAGCIDLKDVWLRYRPTGAPEAYALRGVSLHIPSGAKVGVVGRTGAGKSSLLVALLRLAELDRRPLAPGQQECTSACIDGVDVSQIPLSRLRRACSVIPQVRGALH